MRILIRLSQWAVWARRLGTLALPLVLIPVAMHRAQAIGSPAFEVVEAIAAVVALAGLLASLVAFARLWVTGDKGWNLAATGFVLGLACLAPFALMAADAVLYPLTQEVTTDAADPPPLVAVAAPPAPAPAEAVRIAAAFPNARTRSYPLDPRRVFAIVDALVGDRGWTVLVHSVPDAETGQGQINAIAVTLFGFRSEISIRVTGDPDGTAVAMRSVSFSALHEPGVNGLTIESFLGALDDRISALQDDQPAGTQDEDATDAAAPPIPAPAPAARARKR